jgi:hypothetical protein
MNVGLLVAIIVVGALVLAGGVLVIVFSAVARSRARLVAELQAEGIVLDSGPAHVKVTFHGFRGPRVYVGAGVRGGPGRVVLTQQRLRIVALPNAKYGVGSFPRGAMSALTVGVDGGNLHLRADNAPGTTGTVEFFVTVAEPAGWVNALTQAGARARTG